MRSFASPLALVAAGLAAGTAAASDLTVDGRVALDAQLGDALPLALVGAPNQLAFVAVDVDPGPVTLFGQAVPIGLTPAFQFLAEGQTDPTGTFGARLTLPTQSALDGVTFHLVGVVVDPAALEAPDFSNGVSVTLTADLAPVDGQRVGVPRAAFPHFDWIATVPEGEPVTFALDPTAMPWLAGRTGTVYVTADRSRAEWNADPTLIDLSGDGPDAIVFGAADLSGNTFTVDPGTLSGDGGTTLGVGYDLVVDLDGDGLLSGGDLTDGYGQADGTGDRAGFTVARDPSLAGPLTVVETLYSGGEFLGQDLYYPANIADLADVPLVVVSHGNGHNFQWYDHIGYHLASYGYVVMSHENNTGPGPATAASSTLKNTDYLLENVATIAGGALAGKLDTSRITWIGHSRGGEGIVRAYDRLYDGIAAVTQFGLDDIVLLSSIAPTVFGNKGPTNPHEVDYHLWVGAGDADVSGCANNDIAQSFQIFGRAEEQRASISLYGVGHGWFHDGSGSPFITGPCQIGKTETHRIVRAQVLALVEFHIRGNRDAKDWLWRPYEDLRPQSTADDPCIVANLQWSESTLDGKLEIDGFETSPDPLIASSGATITTTLASWDQGRSNDGDFVFQALASDKMNGMTHAGDIDTEWAGILDYDGVDHVLTYHLPLHLTDWSQHAWLAFAACQRTRQDLTIAELADVVFEVRLVDADGDASTVRIDTHAAGIEEPYQRDGCGFGVGWINDFETVRLGLAGFTVGHPELDLDRIERLEFLFGPSHGSASASLGLDSIELHAD